MYEFVLENFLSNVLLANGLNSPSIQSSVTFTGEDTNSLAIAACSFLTKVFDVLNKTNNTAYNYGEYYYINPNTGSGSDIIVMIESGIMDNPYLKEYIAANCITQLAGG
ncbi:MAG: hypothetical protein EHM58_03555 [Ignavibacteriae bacterium]|nr:MAG: hypothetical protein EHM58_03555 [Ignavibacteriota bacterium]